MTGRRRLAMLLATLVAAALLAFWSLRREPAVLVYEAPTPWLRARCEGCDAEQLLFDGRRQGSLPYALPSRGLGPQRIVVELARSEALAGVVVSWDGAPPARAVVHAGKEHALSTAAGESWALFSHAIDAASLALEYTPAAGTRGVAEIALVPARPPLVLVAPRERADRDAELLATYGYPHAVRLPAASLGHAALAEARLVLSSATLGAAEREQLRALVRGGAWLVELGPLPGICVDAPASLEPASELSLRGRGLDGVSLFAALAALPGCTESGCDGEVLAWATHADGARPFASRHALGRGHCTRLLADLSALVQRLRQGDPARSSVTPSSENLLKPWDLFGGRAPDLLVPHADRLGYALAAWIADAPGPDLLVAPLPPGRGGLVVWTADQDYVPGPGVVAQGARMGEGGMTVTLTDASLGAAPDVRFDSGDPGLLPRAQAAELAAQGHELGLHPALMGVAPGDHERLLAEHVAAFERTYDARPRVVRNHHLVWSGYVDMAVAQARAGLAISLDYVTGPGPSGYHPGFMTGSGLAMRFADEHGALLPLYQQATQVDDYVFAAAGAREVDREVTRRLIADARTLLASARREHTPVTVLHHPAWWFATNSSLQDALLADAAAHGAQVWPAGRWLRFVEARRMTRVSCSPGGGFVLQSPAGPLEVWLDDAQGEAVDVAGRRFFARKLDDASRPITLR
jgi:hypothetical protein